MKNYNYKIKICLRCEKEYKPASGIQKYCSECKSIIRKEQAKRRMKQWYKDHKEKMKEYHKQYRKDNPEYRKQHYQAHKEEVKENVKQYSQTPKGKEVRKRQNAKRKGLGYRPINEPFIGSEGHHYDKERVIHIPEELHKSVNHCLETGVGMEEINRLAIDYLWIEMWDKIDEPEFLKEKEEK